MGRKKKRNKEVDAVRVECYYCAREFATEEALLKHQQLVHFVCPLADCKRRLTSVPGVKVHMMNVHKQELTEAPGSIPGRTSVTLFIHGTAGVPAEGEEEDAKRQKKAPTIAGLPAAYILPPPPVFRPSVPAFGYRAPMMPGFGAPRPPFGFGYMPPPGAPGLRPPPGFGFPPRPPVIHRPPVPPPAAAAAPVPMPATTAAPAAAAAAAAANAEVAPEAVAAPVQPEAANVEAPPPQALPTLPANARLVHPSADISLEEHRARLFSSVSVAASVRF